MRINQNIAALNTYRQLSVNNVNTSKSLEKLSSGLRINRAGDDAAGLAISEKMRAQVRGLDQASRNSQDAISLIQTAEGALSETQSILQRMRELAVQSASDTNVTEDRAAIQSEINQLTSEINRIGNTTEFNTQKLLNGDKLNDFTVTGTSFSGGTASASLLGGTQTLLTGGSALSSGSYTLTVTKTVSSSTITTSGAMINSGLNSGAVLSGTLSEVTYSSSFKPHFSGDNIAITAGSGNAIISASGSGNISIEVMSGAVTQIRVQVSNNSGVSESGYVTANASGKFVFNNYGVSFTIDSISGWDSGAGNAVTYDKSGNVAVDTGLGTAQNVWSGVSLGSAGGAGTSGTLSSAAASIGNITVDSGAAGGDYSIQLVNKDGTSGYLVVTGVSGSGGASGAFLDVISGLVVSGTSYTYNNHGISFTVQMSGLGAGGSGGLSFQVRHESYAADTTTTTYTTSYSGHLIGASGSGLADINLGSSAAATDSGSGIVSTFSGDLLGLHLKFASGAAPTVGSGSFTVDRTTSGEDDSLTFQIGANQNQSMSLSINDMRSAALGVSSAGGGSGFKSVQEVTDGTSATNSEYALDVSTTSGAANAITVINNAINKVSEERSKLGAVQNRLEHTINNLGTSSENLTSAESRVRDVDMARQMMEFTKNNILTQAAQSMLAQANQQPQGVLQLLR